jgi:hypothetical protein
MVDALRCDLLDETFVLVLGDRQEEALLVAELCIEGSERTPGAAHHVVDAGLLITLFKEDFAGRQEEGVAARDAAVDMARIALKFATDSVVHARSSA